VARVGDLGSRNAGLIEPVEREIDPARAGVVHHVAGDVGELDCGPEAAESGDRGRIAGVHDVGHHRRDRSRDQVGVAASVIQSLAGSAFDVFFCTPDQAPHGLRFRQTEMNRRDQERYRRTLDSIQELLSLGRYDPDGDLQVA